MGPAIENFLRGSFKLFKKYFKNLTTESTTGSKPASTSKTFQSGLALNRLAIKLPAGPEPTTIKSKFLAVE